MADAGALWRDSWETTTWSTAMFEDKGLVGPPNGTDANTTQTIDPYTMDAYLIDTRTFQYYAWGVVGNVISVLGLLGNVLSIIVLSTKKMRSSTSYYLIAQAVYDSLVLVALVLFMSLPTIYYQTKTSGLLRYTLVHFGHMQPIGYPLALTVQTCSIYTTVGFTVERYIAVCYPLKAAKMCTIPRARKSLLVILACSVLYNIPRWLEYRTVLYVDPATNETLAEYAPTAIGENATFQHIYFIYVHMSVMLVIPFVVVLVLNTLLVRAVRRSEKAEGKVSTRQRRENNLTVMLISVVAVFLVCQVPSIFDNVFMAIMSKKMKTTKPFIVLTCISSLMVITNSAANFYLYCVFGKKFRSVFCQIFCPCYACMSKKVLGYAQSELRASTKSRTQSAYGRHGPNIQRQISDTDHRCFSKDGGGHRNGSSSCARAGSSYTHMSRGSCHCISNSTKYSMVKQESFVSNISDV